MVKLYLEREEREKMKKKIYTFTVDDEDYPSREFKDNIKVIASLVYDELKCLDYENPKPILVHGKKICDNVLYETDAFNRDCRYTFASEKHENENYLYEPLLLDDKTFGITVYDENITMYEMTTIIDNVLKLLRLNYQFSIDEFSYISKDADDESKRGMTIKKIMSHMHDKVNSSLHEGKVRKLVAPMFMARMIRG